eukprot:ANDGO_07052.mRNA.1 Chaperone protein dnaJ 49
MNLATNADAAEQFLEKARQRRSEGDIVAAIRFAKKAKALNGALSLPVDAFIQSLNAKAHHHGMASMSSSSSDSLSGSEPATPTAAEPEEGSPEEKQTISFILNCKTHYEVLGVDKNADEVAIRKSYKKLALKVHPDRCRAKNTDEAFKRVQRALETLTDSDKRRRYDMYGNDDPQAAQSYSGRESQYGYRRAETVFNNDDAVEEVLRAFGFMTGPRLRRTHPGARHSQEYARTQAQYAHQRQQQQQQEQQSQPGGFMLYNVLPFLLFILLIVLNSASYSSRSSLPPEVCLAKTKACNFQKHLEDGLVFFVSDPNYDSWYRTDVERLVHEKYRSLEKECEGQRRIVNERMMNYMTSHPDISEIAEIRHMFETPTALRSCHLLDDLLSQKVSKTNKRSM